MAAPSGRRPGSRSSRRRITHPVVVVTTAILTITGATSARADTATTNIHTYNRPSIVELGAADYMAWADTSANGDVQVTKLNSDHTQGATWTQSSITHLGTGPTIAAANGHVVVAWTDDTGTIHLAETTGGTGGGFQCETYFNFNSIYTPYLTSEGDDGTGKLYLTWVDSAAEMHVDEIDTPSPGQGCQFSVAYNDLITSADSTWVGPAMAVSGYGTGSEKFWLMWAGTDSTHHLNIATYDQNWTRINKSTESTHATTTDIGAAFNTADGQLAMSYCGSYPNYGVYYQDFSSVTGGTEQHEPGSCDTRVYDGYYSGGVGTWYEYSSALTPVAWPDKTSYLVHLSGTL